MVWPVRACHSLKVSISSGAEPEMNRRMWLAACLVRPGSASMRTYSVGTPMNTVAFAHRFDGQLRVELAEPDHLAAIEQRAVQRHEQAVHVEDRQRVDQHVAPRLQPQ